MQTFTQVLFDLAQRPEYIPELREEIETIAKTEGFTKTSMLKLVKVDSFIKESQRLGGISARKRSIYSAEPIIMLVI